MGMHSMNDAILNNPNAKRCDKTKTCKMRPTSFRIIDHNGRILMQAEQCGGAGNYGTEPGPKSKTGFSQ